MDPVERLHSFVSGFHATYYVYTGVECELFEALVEPRTPDDLADRLDLHRPYVRRFCEVGLRWGLLSAEPRSDVDGTGSPVTFRLEEEFVTPLANADAPQYMGDVFRFAGTYLSEDYAAYPAYFGSGEERPFTARGAAFTDVVEGATRGLQVIFVGKLLPELLSALESRLSRGGRVLDLGCGTGHLACRLCDRYPDAEVVGLDLDGDAIERANERAARYGVSDRATFRTKDAVEVVGEYDAVVLFMSLHEIDPDGRRQLFERLRTVLTDDGVIAAFDEVYPEDDDQFDLPPFVAGVETQWSELVWGNEVPTRSEQRELLAAAGCEERISTTLAGRFVVYEGERV
ncbi:SAM-dependent methyltransferase [Halomarina halobia]|uniref:SAM-dependent methyltransferase n=1 Tax=Halomarina halobia TaxID=3033386 RepID=A0ABD6AFA5_9EURY|nr:methyltransferase domain-containing protein [Halomarina sp. PSR21]